jgi:ubiquinone biosynthesis protein UbiJ
MELVEYFLEHVYTLPRESEDLNQRLETLGQEDKEQAS